MQCHVCGTSIRFFMKKNGYDIYRCPSCGLGQTLLDQEYESFVTSFYDSRYFTGDATRSAYVHYESDKPYIITNMKKILKHIQKIKSTGTLLDVGCAMGYFVTLAHQKGYDAYGVEPSDFAYSKARAALDGKVKHGTLEHVKYPPLSFDVITMLDVFEHLMRPREDLQKLHTMLTKDGIIVIATGDTDSIFAKLLKRRWTFYIPPQHLFFFNRHNLNILLRKEHFEQIRWFRVGKVLSLKYVLHLARTTGESVIANKLYPLVDRFNIGRLPVYLPVRDNIVVIARKI